MKRIKAKKYQKFKVKLSSHDLKIVIEILKSTNCSNRTYRRALVLRLLNLEQSVAQISEEVKITKMGIRKIGKRYLDFGLGSTLRDASRPGKATIIDQHQEKEIVAVVCSAPPHKRSRWTLQLLKEEIIKRKIMKSIGKETLRTFLHEAKVKPWLEKNVVHWGSNRRIYRENGGHS